jgi:hypothetical protein
LVKKVQTFENNFDLIFVRLVYQRQTICRHARVGLDRRQQAVPRSPSEVQLLKLHPPRARQLPRQAIPLRLRGQGPDGHLLRLVRRQLVHLPPHLPADCPGVNVIKHFFNITLRKKS